MGNLRSRILGFMLGIIFLMYVRHYNQEARLMGWSVCVGLGVAFVLTLMRPIKWLSR